MGKGPRVTFRRIPKREGPDDKAPKNTIVNVNEIAYAIAEEWNQYALVTDQWPTLTPNEAASLMERFFTPSDIDFFMHTDFGRGVLGGALALGATLEANAEQLMAERAAAAGIDIEELGEEAIEEFSEEELARIIYDTLTGEKKNGQGEGQH